MEKAVMQITLDTKPFAALETDALVTYIFEESDPIQGRVSEIDAATGGLLKKIAGSGEATGKTLEFTLDPRARWAESHSLVARRRREARTIQWRHAAQSCGSRAALS